MGEGPESPVLRLLESIRQQNTRVADALDSLKDDMRDLRLRMTGLEEGLAGMNRPMDRFEVRLDRIERRLELADAH